MYVEALDVVKYYGSVEVLKKVSLRIEKPMVYSLLGPNGAGKSTFLNILAGVQKPSSGRVLIKGFDVSSAEAKHIIGYCPQDVALYERLSGWDNIFFYASLYGVPRSEAKRRAGELLKLLNLESYASQRVAKYSGGMKKKLSLIVTLIHDPEVVILDEPTEGLDPESRLKVWGVVKRLRDEGKVVIIATHNMDEADRLSDRVGIIDRGKLLVEDSPENLKRMYGPPSVVEIVLRERPSENLIKRLREASKGAYSDERTLKIHVEEPDRAIPMLTELIYEAGSRIDSLKVVRPTLEDVFFRLTGRRLE
ncbi:ABC transporter related [Ignisphaera aggregans DSM 17230]|uniref:ABC transporter related n=1 Tax=Ignisphaera aggregans (strain DSM 17230 / JCM 13409 / AQ1.S1) TaxID=583356 RepID=E0STK1_IGNAA|nr:ABC transporter related [Ignisphaera aggregans DSM 17230]